MKRHRWTAEEVEILIRDYPDEYAADIARKLILTVWQVYRKADHLGLKKSARWQCNERVKQGDRLRRVGVYGRFQPGSISVNKGKKWHEYKSESAYQRSLATTYKKGHRPHNTKHDGCVTIRRNPNGKHYKFIRLAKNEWVHLHRLLWIFLNGDIPVGKVLRCKSDDTLNCDPSNWELADRRQHLGKNIGRDIMSDKYMSLIISRRDPQLRKELMKYPEILEIKRTQLKLKEAINGTAD